jgi:hypothetical protein
MNRYCDPVLALFAVQCVPYTTAWALANIGGTFAHDSGEGVRKSYILRAIFVRHGECMVSE